MKLINWIMSWLTMQRRECLFVDKVSGKEVFRYTDCFGCEYMANFHCFGFRVRRTQPEVDLGPVKEIES